MTNRRNIDERIAEEASTWLLRTQDGPLSRDQQRELDKWLSLSDTHASVYASLQETWDMMALVELGQEHAANRDGLRSLFEPFRPVYQRIMVSLKSAKITGVVAAGLVLFVMVFVNFEFQPNTDNAPSDVAFAQRYETLPGIQETATLQDGSAITLNTDTKITTQLTPTEREVDLVKGEAYFKVVHNPDRPFVVTAGEYKVTVLGTEFSVQKNSKGVEVKVSSGRVSVETRDTNTSDTVVLVGGDTISGFSEGRLGQVEKLDPIAAFAWREGLIVFDNTPLRAVISELNRYQKRQILMRCESATEETISGVFRVDSLEETIDTVITSASLVAGFTSDSSMVLLCKP